MGHPIPFHPISWAILLGASWGILLAPSPALRNYQNYNWTCFEDLKDHRLEPEAEASEAKDVAAAEPLTEAAVATAGA